MIVDASENGQMSARSIAHNANIFDNFDPILIDDQIQGVTHYPC